VKYTITATVKNDVHAGTSNKQYVKIKGDKGQTEEFECNANFVYGRDATCSIESKAYIGQYKCIVWRTTGTDGMDIMKVKFFQLSFNFSYISTSSQYCFVLILA
jgi:hypothetical protein